jgi:tRNA threonylcarbamoyladenosine biosynthesis protein TsaE
MSEARQIISASPDETFALGEKIGAELTGGEVILLTGGLGAGKTLLTKGILSAVHFDVDEVTSPSFALVNLYRTPRFDVYHIDLWRSDGDDPAFSVGLEEILEDEKAVVIVEWAERLRAFRFGRTVYHIDIAGDGDEARRVDIRRTEQMPAASV